MHAKNIYCYAGNFSSSLSPAQKTAQNIIGWAPAASSLEDVLIANGSTATVNSGIDLFAYNGSTASLRNVVGLYGTAPTGAHVYYESSSTGDFRLENTYGNQGAQTSGTVPGTNAPNPALRQVAGPVSDASFQRTPANGTLAVDTVNGRLYARVNGVWKSAPLS